MEPKRLDASGRVALPEIIVCPGCGRLQTAEIWCQPGQPWPVIAHECECGYLIGESEWMAPDIDDLIDDLIDEAWRAVTLTGHSEEMTEIDWKQEYHRQQQNLSHERQLANVALDENENLKAELSRVRAERDELLVWSRRAHFLLRVAMDDMSNWPDRVSVKRCVESAPAIVSGQSTPSLGSTEC